MDIIVHALKKALHEKKIDTKGRTPYQSELLPSPHAWGPRNSRSIEGIDGLCQRLECLLQGSGGKIVQFIGSRKGEGTSTIVKHFAGIAALHTKKSVLVLDTDREYPVQQVLFDVQPKYCLNEVTADGGPIDRAYCQVDDPRLSVCLVSGNSVSPAQVLNVNGLWEKLRIHFDLVIVDSPPLEVSSDALAMVPRVDGVILVIEAERTRWPVVQNSKDSIIAHGGNILGAVFNKRRYHIPGWIYKWL
jgi:protein-tyrosine kinase